MIDLVHSTHVTGKVNFSGCISMSGKQKIDDNGGCPTWVGEVFDKYPEISEIAFNQTGSYREYGVVYYRIPLDK